MWHGVHVKPEEIDFNALFTAFVPGLHKEPSFSCLSKKLFPLSISLMLHSELNGRPNISGGAAHNDTFNNTIKIYEHKKCLDLELYKFKCFYMEFIGYFCITISKITFCLLCERSELRLLKEIYKNLPLFSLILDSVRFFSALSLVRSA